jgi:hypothetical protein
MDPLAAVNPGHPSDLGHEANLIRPTHPIWWWRTCPWLSTMDPMLSLRSIAVAALLLGLTGCGSYDPPVLGDHASEHYKADLEACRTSSSHAVYIKNAGSPGTWIISPITGPPEVRAEIRTCMTAKGYTLQKSGG